MKIALHAAKHGSEQLYLVVAHHTPHSYQNSRRCLKYVQRCCQYMCEVKATGQDRAEQQKHLPQVVAWSICTCTNTSVLIHLECGAQFSLTAVSLALDIIAYHCCVASRLDIGLHKCRAISTVLANHLSLSANSCEMRTVGVSKQEKTASHL